MEYQLDHETLQFISLALREPSSPSRLSQAKTQAKRIIERGWAFKADVEDLLYNFDSRLGYQVDIVKFSNMLEIHWEEVFFRPSAKSNYATGLTAVRAENLTHLLISLERIGFQTHPAIFVDLLLPRIKSRIKQVLNSAELEIFWFSKTRHRYEKIFLRTQFELKTIKTIASFTTVGNYHIVVRGMNNETSQLIEISSPKFRKRPDLIPVTCKDCGHQWHKGDPESSASHRKEHKRCMYYLDPQPLVNVLKERESAQDVELVTTNSPGWKHKEMYLRARAFKREFNYDFVQWQSDKGDNDPYVHGYLFTDGLGAIVGACSFRLPQRERALQQWTLDWIWICPRERRKGHLARRWKTFRERFGNFSLTFPISAEMKTFLAKHGDLKLMEK
jgi:hypothetical protein